MYSFRPALLLLALLSLFASSARAAITHIQSYSQQGTSVGSAVTFPAFTAIGANDTVVGLLLFHNLTNTISSVVAGSNTLSTQDYTALPVGSAYSAIAVALAHLTGGPTTITVNFTGAPTGTDHYLQFDEYAGVLSLGEHSFNTAGTAASSIAVSITTAISGDTIWTGLQGPTPATTPTSFTRRNMDATNQQHSADMTQGAAGPITVTWPFTSGFFVYETVIALQVSCGQRALSGVGC